MACQLLITFDVEDFINQKSTNALLLVLKQLEKHNLRGLFFITGHAAEKLRFRLDVLPLLEKHEIGFHSSAHSVHPTIFEYSDEENYEDAYAISLKRETSHINPISGQVEGEGGIHALRDLFPSKKINSYRAPGWCCPPPHLEALASLGIEYDFSWNLSENPVSYRGITFYPMPLFRSCEDAFLTNKYENAHQAKIWFLALARKAIVLDFHPSILVNENFWDSIYHAGNPSRLIEVTPRDGEHTRIMFTKLEALLRWIKLIEKLGITNTSPLLTPSENRLDLTRIDLRKIEEGLTYWPRTFFGYKSKFIGSQLSSFLCRKSTSLESTINL